MKKQELKLTLKFFPAFLVVIFAIAPLFGQSSRDSMELRIEPPYFSPNDDGIQDQAFFSPVLQSQGDVTRWRLVIKSERGKKVRKLTGAGFSALVQWDGLSKKGILVEDGNYSAVMTVWGRRLKLSSPSRDFVADTSPPLVEISVSTRSLGQSLLSGDAFRFYPEFVDESPIERWQLQVLDITGRTVYVKSSSGTANEIFWNGKDQTTDVLVPRGTYRIALQAWDAAGNESEPVFTDVSVNVTAREMLQQVLQYASIVETDLGLIVQLNGADLFRFNRKRKPVLRDEASLILREVAILINAYPEAQVRLDGYSRNLKTASKDRHRSSLYAWKVYSNLVKKGNVKPSRLQVRGRGRHPMFDRRGVPLDVIKSGVEVRLEGLTEW